jgi:hypothetical protein
MNIFINTDNNHEYIEQLNARNIGLKLNSILLMIFWIYFQSMVQLKEKHLVQKFVNSKKPNITNGSIILLFIIIILFRFITKKKYLTQYKC